MLEKAIVAVEIFMLEMDDHPLAVCTENSPIKVCSFGVHFQLISAQNPESEVHLEFQERYFTFILHVPSLSSNPIFEPSSALFPQAPSSSNVLKWNYSHIWTSYNIHNKNNYPFWKYNIPKCDQYAEVVNILHFWSISFQTELIFWALKCPYCE